MDLALTINGWIDEEVIFAQQLGSQHVFAQVDSHPQPSMGWDAPSLARLANRIEKAGLVLAGLYASVPARGAGLEENLAWAARLAGEAGAAGIGLLSLSAALFTGRRPAGQQLSGLLAAPAGAAAQAGVKLAVPLAPLLNGKAGWVMNPESVLQRLPASAGLEVPPGWLLGWLEETSPEPAQRQAILDRLCLVSYENERRPGEKPASAGFDELLGACWRLRQAGYPGLIRLGRPLPWVGDTREGHQARAFTTGYLRAVLQAFQKANTPG